MATSPLKSRVIYVHRNGDKTDKGSRMVLHPTKMRDYEQLKSEMTAKVQLVTGAVRKVFSKETGAEITALDQFEHDKHYVCCGGEKLKIESLSQGASPKPSAVATSGATTPSRAPLLSQNTPEKGKNVYFFRNGDKHYAGAKFVIHSKKYKRFDQLLTDLSIKVGVSTGAVRRVYTASGELIDDMDKLEEGGKYICCGGERFDHENIPKGITGERASPSPAKTPTKRPSTSGTPSSIGRSPKAPIEKFGTQTEKGRVIFAFQNGDKHHKGVRLVIHAKKYKTIEQVKVQLSSQLSLPTGPVQKILRFESLDEKPVEVKDVAAFEDGANYIVCGPEPLNKENIPGTLLELSAKRSKASAAAAAAAHDEPEPEPAHVPEPAPVAVAVEPAHVPEPVPVAAEPAPEPVPEPVAAEPVPEPQAAPAVEPEAAAPVNQDDDDDAF